MDYNNYYYRPTCTFVGRRKVMTYSWEIVSLRQHKALLDVDRGRITIWRWCVIQRRRQGGFWG